MAEKARTRRLLGLLTGWFFLVLLGMGGLVGEALFPCSAVTLAASSIDGRVRFEFFPIGYRCRYFERSGQPLPERAPSWGLTVCLVLAVLASICLIRQRSSKLLSKKLMFTGAISGVALFAFAVGAINVF
jgi:hypothetical protein